MDSTFTANRRGAHRRVGAAATASFVALLLLFAVHGSAAGGTVPAPAPAAAPTIQPQQAAPSDPDPGFRHGRGGFGRRGPGGEPGFRGGGGGESPGGGAAPIPDSGGTTT
jgi:hypothetical protein